MTGVGYCFKGQAKPVPMIFKDIVITNDYWRYTMSENKLVEEEQAVVEQGVHNFSSEDKWVKPEDPRFWNAWNGSRTRSWA